MSSFKRNEDLEFDNKNDIIFVKSTALLAILIIVNFIMVNNIIF